MKPHGFASLPVLPGWDRIGITRYKSRAMPRYRITVVRQPGQWRYHAERTRAGDQRRAYFGEAGAWFDTVTDAVAWCNNDHRDAAQLPGAP